ALFEDQQRRPAREARIRGTRPRPRLFDRGRAAPEIEQQVGYGQLRPHLRGVGADETLLIREREYEALVAAECARCQHRKISGTRDADTNRRLSRLLPGDAPFGIAALGDIDELDDR